MECRDVRPLVDAFVSDQLLVETTEAIVAHLERCPACRAEVEGLRRLRAATRSAFANARELEARPEFLSSLHGRLQAEAARQTRVTRPRWTWLAVAASLTLLIMAGTGWREWTVRSLTALVNAAVRDHRFCTLTSTPGAQRMSLEEAARRYGVFNRALETVQPQVDSLDGGPIRILERHSCVFDGERFAHIVLAYKGSTVSLLVPETGNQSARVWGLGPPAGGPPSALVAQDGFHVAAFPSPGRLVFVVSDLPQHDVQDVARAMAGPVTQALGTH